MLWIDIKDSITITAVTTADLYNYFNLVQLSPSQPPLLEIPSLLFQNTVISDFNYITTIILLPLTISVLLSPGVFSFITI